MRDGLVIYSVCHGLINNIETKAKCRHLQKLTCKGQVFIRVHRLKMQSIMLVFSTQLCELLPLSPSLWFNSPPLTLPSVKVQHILTVCDWEVEGGAES